MKKFTALIYLLLILSEVANSQEPFSLIRLDSTIYKVYEAIGMDNGDFIIAGNNRYGPASALHMFIARINNEGDILWKKDHSGAMSWTSSLIKKSDGNYFIAMNGPNKTGFLLETNNEGDSIWSWTTAPLYGNSKLGPIREFSDGGFILAENIYSTDYAFPPIECNYYCLNPDGNIISAFDASSVESFDIVTVSGDEFISAERDYQGIVKYNIAGEILNIDTCIEHHYYYFWSITKLNENRYFTTGQLNLERGLISEFDKNGNFAYCSVDTSIAYFEGTIPINESLLLYHGVNNEGEIVIGEFVPPDHFFPRLELESIRSLDYTLLVSNEYIYIFSQVDPFPMERAVFVKIPLELVISKVEQIDADPIKVYPNPAKDYVIFDVEEELAYNTIITIYDAYGRKIESFNFSNHFNVWDTRNVITGVYFFTLISGNLRTGGKIFIIK